MNICACFGSNPKQSGEALILNQNNHTKTEAESVVQLAKLLTSYGLDDRAFHVLKLAKWLAPDDLRIWLAQAQVLVKLRRWDEALQVITDLSSKGKTTSEMKRLQASAHWALGERDRGNRAYHAACLET
jgi:predicted Zn-dependent protease